MNDMDPVHVAGNAVQTTLTYFDGQQRSVLASTTEVPYPEGKLIVSRTDTRGIITQCNQAFIDMSGYQESELIGQPHCLLRHPDMPKAAYACGQRSMPARSGTATSRICARMAVITGSMPSSCRTFAMARSSASPRSAASHRAARSTHRQRSMST